MSDSPTQTIEVEAFSTTSERSKAMRRQLEEIFARIDATPAVLSSLGELESAKAKLFDLRQSQSRLSGETHRLSREMAELTTQAETSIIAGGAALEFASVLSQKEAEHRLATRAHQRLVERALPEAEIHELNQHAVHLAAKARATRVEAAERIERTAKLMADAAAFEGHISFNPAHTLSGALTAHAEEMEQQVDNYRRWAAERSEKHQRVLRDVESIQGLRS